MISFFRRKPEAPAKPVTPDLGALRAAREAAAARYAKAGHGERTEAYEALVRANHKLMQAELSA